MGGEGSGRWYRWEKKLTVEEALGLSISKFTRARILRPYQQGTLSWRYGERDPFARVGYAILPTGAGALALTLHYCVSTAGSKEDIEQSIALQTTNPNFGGVRWWFTCPDCQRRVGNIYLPADRLRFGCRRCCDLTYRSAQEHDRRLSFLLKHPEDFNELLGTVLDNPHASDAAVLLAMKATTTRQERFWIGQRNKK